MQAIRGQLEFYSPMFRKILLFRQAPRGGHAWLRPTVVSEPNAVPESKHVEFDDLQEENKQLRELVIQLSKLVIKYVVQQH
jgi:hypothetical protein